MSASTVDVPVTSGCPKCGKPLIDPAGLGWCQACGYCKSLGGDTVKPAEAPAKEAREKAAPTAPAGEPTKPAFPVWPIVLGVGTAAVVVGTLVVSKSVPLTPLHRALWTTLQIASGVALMFVAQFAGLLAVAHEEATLGIKDALLPFRLYPMIMARLPRLQGSLYLGAWGLAAAVSALVFVGGLGHWMTYLPQGQSKTSQWR